MLCATEDGLRERPLPELSQSVMWSLMMLCTTSERFPMQVRWSEKRRGALSAVDTRDELPVFDRGGCSGGSELAVSTGRGMDGPTKAMPQGRGHGRVAKCKKVVALICAHVHRVFTVFFFFFFVN